MAAPLAADKFDAWTAWTSELTGSRQAEFDDMNRRHGLDEHRAYLQPLPDGNYLVLVMFEGAGAESFMPNVTQSGHDFDRWFTESVVDLHGFDLSAPMPPLAARKI